MSDIFQKCPICKLSDQRVLAEKDYGDKVTFDCVRCGSFTISGTAETLADRIDRRLDVSAWLRERNLLGIEIPMLTTNFLSEIAQTLPSYSPIQKQTKLLRALSLLTDYPGEVLPLNLFQSTSLAWAKNHGEFSYHVNSLIERGLLKRDGENHPTLVQNIIEVQLTVKGWVFLEDNASVHIDSEQAFIAMSFDPALRSIYDSAIKPAVEATGHSPYRVDETPHLERIDAKIVSEIKNSKFLIADVTQQKAGVYYEAGLAHGLGLPVIWCVRRSELENVHFDTRQFNHILWEEEAQLRTELETFILATIGKK